MPRVRSAGRDPLTWMVVSWCLANVVWLRRNRWSWWFELDEAAYVGLAVASSQRHLVGASVRDPGQPGNHGPLQAILALPPQMLLGVEPRLVLLQNVMFGAGTAVAAGLTVRRLSTRGAGTVAAAIVLLAPGILDHSRLALTSTPATFFAALTVYLFVRAGGLERTGWAALAGCSLGCMTLGRSMAIGFVPALGVMALGWAWTRRTSLAVVVVNGTVVAAAGLATAGWWWWLRWDAVGPYLFGGGSSDTVRYLEPTGKFALHVHDALWQFGLLAPAVAFAAALVLWPRRSARSRRETVADVIVSVAATVWVLTALWRVRWGLEASDGLDGWALIDLLVAAGVVAAALLRGARIAARTGDGSANPVDDPAPMAAWPVWAGTFAGLLVLTRSTELGVGFVLPFVPWLAVAATVSVRRVLGDLGWKVWWMVVVVAAVVPALVIPGPGFRRTLVWCFDESVPNATCDVVSTADGIGWHQVNDRIARRIQRAAEVGREAGRADVVVALTQRDFVVNPNTVRLAMSLRDQPLVPIDSFLTGADGVAAELQRVRDQAELVVVVPDRYDEIVLSAGSPAPEEVVAAVTDAGFYRCDAIPTPDGRSVLVLAAPEVSDAACQPLDPVG